MKLLLEPFKNEIISLYENGNSIQKISLHFNCYQQPIVNLLKYYKKYNPRPKNTLDEHYFNVIDTYSKAYIVGFIAADGCLVKHSKTSHVLTITIKNDDISILNFIKKELKSSHKIQKIIRPFYHDPSRNCNHVRLAFSNRYIAEDLLSLGLQSKKSLTMDNILVNIPYEFRNAFIIGYFDGDGSVILPVNEEKKFNKTLNKEVSYPNRKIWVSIRGTEKFLKGINTHLEYDTYHIHNYDSIPRLEIKSKKQIIKFFNCYKNLDFFLERKYNRFLQRINHSVFDKYK